MNSLQTKNKITGLVITLNEEKNIADVISNLDFVDELIIVDSFSSDKTKEICQQHPHVIFLENKFENYSSQRNFALQQASNEWVLFIDADERINPKLKKEILKTIQQPQTDDAYYFYRKFMFDGKPLSFSGWQTDKNIRLFKKDHAVYVPERLVHEKLVVNGKIGVLKQKLIHFSYSDYDSYKHKMLFYGELKAKELLNKNLKPNWFHFYVKPTYKFLYSYIIRLGFLDGKKGLVICYLNALSIYHRYQELKKVSQ